MYLPETDTFVEMRMFPIMHHRDFPCVERNTLTIFLRFFISYCPLIDISSTQLWLYHTHTHTHTRTHARTHAHTHTNTHAYIHTHLYTHAHTSLKVPFSSLNFCLSNEELGYLNNLKF